MNGSLYNTCKTSVLTVTILLLVTVANVRAGSSWRFKRQIPGVVLPPGIRPDDSGPECNVRSSCFKRGDTKLSFFKQNCFCDEDCTLYDDCCADFVTQLPTPPKPELRQIKKLTTCDRIEEYSRKLAIYFIHQCPSEFADMDIRAQCEDQSSQDKFLTWPVVGAMSRLLFKNYYCAHCYGETNITFWNANYTCPDPSGWRNESRTGSDAIVRDVTGHDFCSRHFVPQIKPRRCHLNLISKCDNTWKDKRKKKKVPTATLR